MKKLLLILLLIIPLVYAIEECDSPIEPSDIPCMVISTYSYEPDCPSNSVKIFNSTPTLLQEIVWDDYSDTGRCNVTFNLTDRDSYTLNSTDGSSATIIVRGVKMEFLRLTVFGIFFLLGFILIAYMHKFKEDEGSSIAYGFFAASLYAVLGSLISFGYEIINTEALNLPFNVNTMLAIICYVLVIYTAFYSYQLYRFKMGEHDSIKEKDEYKPQ